MKAAVKRLPYSPRVRLPCTYGMVLYIIQQNTEQQGDKDRFMLAVGVHYLCLRASEYVSKTNPDAIAFLQLVYLWSRMSTRLPDDPFLSYRSDSGTIQCLVYATVHDAIAQCATVFGFDPQWFKPHSAPTVLRASGGDDGDILNLGRWKQVPTSLIYQGTSTKNNNRVLRAVSSPTLFCCRYQFNSVISRRQRTAPTTNSTPILVS
jgi:hypothetical protein